MSLPELWFILIAFFWAGYFLLEGFDFGVGMLLPWVARGERDRRTMLNSIGPVWDGNEVWLVVAAGATFAAFPAWYATVFSGYYLALLLVLLLLIVRVVSFEWSGKADDPRWRAAWSWVNTVASVGVPFLWGVTLASFVGGVPLDGGGDFAGDVLDMLSPYTVVCGLVTVLLFAFHGASFLGLRTDGALRARTVHAARVLAVPAAVGVIGALGWTVAVAVDRNDRDLLAPAVVAALGVLALVVAVVLAYRGRGGWTFAMTGFAAVLWVATIFTALYPHVLVSDPDLANGLTIADASSSHYALTVMTVAAAILAPIVLLYQAWTYRVLRARVSGGELLPSPPGTDGRGPAAGEHPAG